MLARTPKSEITKISAAKKKSETHYPSGKKRPETGIAPSAFVRMREHAVRLAIDPRLATVIGRMGLFKELTPAEADAGWKVAEVYGRFEALEGVPRRTAASPSYQSSYGKREIDTSRMSPDELKRLERTVRRAGKAYRRLQDWFTSNEQRALVERACVDDEMINPVLKPQLAAALRQLAERWGLVPPSAAKNQPATVERPEYENVLVQAAVDSIAAWFAENTSSSPTCFHLVENADWKAVRGLTGSDGRYTHTVPIPLRGLTPETVDVQIRLACAIKGWVEVKDTRTGELA